TPPSCGPLREVSRPVVWSDGHLTIGPRRATRCYGPRSPLRVLDVQWASWLRRPEGALATLVPSPTTLCGGGARSARPEAAGREASARSVEKSLHERKVAARTSIVEELGERRVVNRGKPNGLIVQPLSQIGTGRSAFGGA